MRDGFALTLFFSFVISCGIAPADAQWVNVPAGTIPRTADGKPDLAAPAPRLADGTPDLSGIWQPNAKYVSNLAADLKAGDVPLQPWAQALYDERKRGLHAAEDPPANCLPQGVPRINAAPLPWKIVQMPRLVLIVYEVFNLWRQIFLDGRELGPPANVAPTWLGYSTGHWDKETLVVDTKGFNGRTWLDQSGLPATESLHVTERFRRVDYGHMDVQITIDDARAYTRPWTVTEPVRLLLDTELMEFACNENNVALQRLPVLR